MSIFTERMSPLLESLDDPRVEGKATKIRYHAGHQLFHGGMFAVS